METQKKYHNLVLLDENGDSNQLDFIKSLSIAFLFLTGIVVGAIFISLLYQKDYVITQGDSTLSTVSPISDPSSQDTAPVNLQSITDTVAINSPSASECGIESLGRNTSEQGCSAADYKDVALDESPTGSLTGISELGDLSTDNGGLIKTDVPQKGGGMTNILDLQ